MQPRLERAQARLGHQLAASALPRLLARAAVSSVRRSRSRIEAYENAPSPNTIDRSSAPRSVCRYCCQKCSGTATPVHISRDCAVRQPSAAKRSVAASTAAAKRPAAEHQAFHHRWPARSPRGCPSRSCRRARTPIRRADRSRPARLPRPMSGTSDGRWTTLSPTRSQARPIGTTGRFEQGLLLDRRLEDAAAEDADRLAAFPAPGASSRPARLPGAWRTRSAWSIATPRSLPSSGCGPSSVMPPFAMSSGLKNAR